jgi:hypothetical protein
MAVTVFACNVIPHVAHVLVVPITASHVSSHQKDRTYSARPASSNAHLITVLNQAFATNVNHHAKVVASAQLCAKAVTEPMD